MTQVKVIFDGENKGAVSAARGTERAIRDVGDESRRSHPHLKALGTVAALGVGAAFVGLASVVRAGFDEIAEGQVVAAQTGAVLKSTGGIANVTAAEIGDLAGSLSRLTGIDDELVQKGENLLLTFKNVRNEVGAGNDIFNQATAAALNLSVAGFGSVESASKMMGKALNDPIAGMTALGRAGVTFSEEQKTAIDAMVKSNDLLGAQKIILQEVESQVGGSAAAFGETLPGQLAKARNSFSEIAASVADVLLPYLLQLLDWVNRNMPTIQRVIETTLDAVIGTIEFLVPIIGTLIGWFQRLSAATQEHWPRIRAVIQSVIDWFRANVLPTITSVVNTIMALWRRFGDEITAYVGAVFRVLATIIGAMLRNIQLVIQGVLALIRGDWSAAWEALKGIVSNTLSGLKATIGTILTNLVPAVLRLAGAIGKAIINGIIDGFTGLLGSLKETLISGVQGAVGGLKGALGIGSPSRVMADEVGKPLAEGVIQGWITGSQPLPEKMKEGIRNAIEAARTAVEEKRGVFAQAFQTLTSEALTAFDQLASEMETRTEKQLRLMDERAAAAERKAKITEARAALEAAVGAGLSLTQGADEAPEKFAERQRTAGEAIKAAQKELDDALAAQQRFVLEQRAAKERAALDERNALRRRHFEEDLLALSNYAERHALTAEQLNQRLLKIFGKYHVPFKEATVQLGSALAEGLREAAVEVGNAAAAVRNEIMKHLSNIQVRVNVDVVVPDTSDRDKPKGRQHGGPVMAGVPYLVGERGPEILVPRSSGAIIPNHALRAGAAGLGGMTNIVNVTFKADGYFVGSKRELEEQLATAIAPLLPRVAMYESRV